MTHWGALKTAYLNYTDEYFLPIFRLKACGAVNLNAFRRVWRGAEAGQSSAKAGQSGAEAGQSGTKAGQSGAKLGRAAPKLGRAVRKLGRAAVGDIQKERRTSLLLRVSGSAEPVKRRVVEIKILLV